MSPEFLAELPDRIRAVLTNLLTYLTLGQSALVYVVAQGYLDSFPTAAQYVALALLWLGAVITFIRRVTPVAQSERGLLPSDS